ncbi:MAG TPA: hypothetical protein VFS30_17460 [Dehalococcoidia bacterium]|nr:hypothetical protein [Dehalococcoidia bacterium]
MSTLGFTDQRARLRRILENSLEGALYDSSETEEDGRMVVLRARRQGGQRVSVRFRAVTSSDATEEPRPGDVLSLRGVDLVNPGCLSLLAFAFPRFRSPGPGYARVRIDAGAARLDIVCQDAEWWEDTGTA